MTNSSSTPSSSSDPSTDASSSDATASDSAARSPVTGVEFEDACAGFDSPGECREAAAELFTYLDGALTDERRARIAVHLDSCTGCFDAFEFHAELRLMISQKCRSQLPEGLQQRIRAALAAIADTEPNA